MKKIFLGLVFFLPFIFSNAQTGQRTYVEKFPNGNVRIKGNYISPVEISPNDPKDVMAQKMGNAKKVGKWEIFYESGKPAAEEFYNNGVMTGKWNSWYESGSKQYEIDFTSGQAVIYHVNGNVQSKGKMLPGMLMDGKWIGYHDNGKVNFEGSYKAGNKDGEWKFYDEKGNHYASKL